MKRKTVPKKKKGFKVFLIIFLLIIIVFLFMEKGNQQKIISFIFHVKDNISKDKTLETVQTIPMNFKDEKANFYDGITIKLDNKKLTAYNLEGSKEWERNINIDEELVFLGDKFVYLFEKNTGYLYFIKSNGEIAKKIKTQSSIFNIVEKGNDLVLLFKEPEIESINIINEDGELLGETSIKEDHIFSVAINNEKTKYAFSTFSIKDGKMSNHLYIEEMDGKEVNDMDLGENLILYIQFIDNDNILALTDKEIISIEKGETIWAKDFEAGKDVFLDKTSGEIYLLYDNKIEIFSKTGESKKQINLDESYKKIIPFGKELLLYGDKDFMLLNGENKVSKYKSEEKVEDLIVKNPYILIFNSDKINIMEFEKNFKVR